MPARSCYPTYLTIQTCLVPSFFLSIWGKKKVFKPCWRKFSFGSGRKCVQFTKRLKHADCKCVVLLYWCNMLDKKFPVQYSARWYSCRECAEMRLGVQYHLRHNSELHSNEWTTGMVDLVSGSFIYLPCFPFSALETKPIL